MWDVKGFLWLYISGEINTYNEIDKNIVEINVSIQQDFIIIVTLNKYSYISTAIKKHESRIKWSMALSSGGRAKLMPALTGARSSPR